jgi:hypothetical protein
MMNEDEYVHEVQKRLREQDQRNAHSATIRLERQSALWKVALRRLARLSMSWHQERR